MNRPYACLSVRQPWASLIVAGIKPIENRPKPCRFRGKLVIHASKTWGRDERQAYDELLQIAIDMGDARRQDIIYRSKDLRGGLVGWCNMRGYIDADEWFKGGGLGYDGRHEWFVGPFGYILTGAREFPHLISFKGQLGIFNVPASMVADYIERTSHA